MTNRRSCFAIWVFLVTVGAASAEAQNNTNVGEASISAWTPTPDLVLQSGSLTAATGIAEVDFVQEFGIEKKTFPEFRFAVGRAHKFRFSHVPIHYDAETIVQRTITFRGRTFNVGIPATTDIKWDLWRFGYQWDFVSVERGYFGVMTELKYNRLDASIASTVLAQTVSTQQKAPVPTVGVAGRVYPHPLVAISGEFSGMKVAFGDFEGKFVDFDLNGAVTLGKYIGVQGGYRVVTVHYVIDDDIGDLKLKGPYIGAVVKF
jgi:hypothetical protein